MSTGTAKQENGVLTMTSNTNVDPTKAGTLAQQIVAILMDEDSVTRHRAIRAAMMLLGEAAPQHADGQADSSSASGGDGHVDLGAFFNRDGDMKPADYAHLCAAYHYSLYGPVAFSLVELKAIATDAGVIIPDRVDMTLRNATQKGKKFFQTSGSGAFKPTAAACLHFAEKWKVKPGKKTKPAGSPKGTKNVEA